MELIIEFSEEKGILLKLPKRSPDGQLQNLAVDSSSGLMHHVDSSRWDELLSGEAVEVPLPTGSWRHILRRMQHTHDFLRKPANEKYRRGISEAKFDDGPLMFRMGNKEYTNPSDIPYDFEEIEDLGTFSQVSSTMLVTDPCYEKGTWCTGEFEALTGTWHARVVRRDDTHSGMRNAILIIAHDSVALDSLNLANLLEWEELDNSIGVDSGQAGFFDKNQYPQDPDTQPENSSTQTWYERVCDITLEDEAGNAGIAPDEFGVVSQTFWGDGGYPCFVMRNEAGQVMASVMVFDGSVDTEDEDEAADEPDENLE